jgi:hypothetical protein
MQFFPTPLGESLISAYRKMGLANLWLPTLRGVIERNITAVAAGQRTKESVLAEAVEAFRWDFEAAQAQVGWQAMAWHGRAWLGSVGVKLQLSACCGKVSGSWGGRASACQH